VKVRGCEQAYQHGDGARHVVGGRLCDLVLELESHAHLVQADAPDAVHSMRVTVRRLRSNLATFRPILDRTVTDPLRDELKWLGGLLGEARDAEVLWAGLTEKLQQDPPHLVPGGVTELVDRELGGRYRHAHGRCVAVMSSGRYSSLFASLRRLAEAPPWTEGPDPGTDVLRQRVRHDWRRLDRRVAALEEDGDEEAGARGLHDVRKAVKRVRYGVEPLVASYGEPAQQLVDEMKKVQTVLGDHQDAIVAGRELLVLSTIAAERHVDAFELGRLHELTREDARRTAGDFGWVWQQASRKRYRRWL
jgi:CHAD domain-containing protein